jgi:hypothetical protein
VTEPKRQGASTRTALSAGLQLLTAATLLGAVAAVVWLKVIRTTRESPTSAISRLTGRSVSCTKLGVLPLAGGRAMVLLCADSIDYHACWADLGAAVSDVSDEVRAMRVSFGGSIVSC